MLIVVDLVLVQDPPQMGLIPCKGAVQELAAASPIQRSAVADHEPDPVRVVAEVHDQVTGLLSGPRAGWMRGDAEDADAPGRVPGHGQDVGPGCRQADRL